MSGEVGSATPAGEARAPARYRLRGVRSRRPPGHRAVVAGVVAVVLAGSLVAGYSVRRHEAGLHLRPRPATSGSAPWPVSAGRHASARLSASRRVPPRPPPAADPSDPGAALAVGGFDLGEPFVLATGSGYSLFTSQSLPLVDLPVVTAAPKGSWGVEADALSSAPTWAAPGPLTGPDAAPLDGHWILFFAAQDAAPDRAPGTGSAPGAVAGARLPRCIGTAVAASPDGPYTPAPAPLVCPGAGGGDPRLFAGPDGTPYLAWVSGASAAGGAAVWSQQLSAAGTALVGQPAVVYRPDLPWQQGTMASAGMLTGGGRTWLVYSAGGGFTSPTDAVGIAACDGPLGPCADRSAFPLLASNAQGAGPGDPTALVTGGQDWLVYNPGYSVGGATARSVDVARLGFGPQGPYLATSGLPPAGPAGQSTPAVPAAATGAVEPGAAPVVDGGGIAAVEAAASQLGVAYVWGAAAPGIGFDCSGLTQWAWGRAGVAIPRTAAAQYAALRHVPVSSVEPGDLLFYYDLDGDRTVDHVVMYVGVGPYGTGTVVQAPSPGHPVSYAAAWSQGLVGAARP